MGRRPRRDELLLRPRRPRPTRRQANPGPRPPPPPHPGTDDHDDTPVDNNDHAPPPPNNHHARADDDIERGSSAVSRGQSRVGVKPKVPLETMALLKGRANPRSSAQPS